MLCVCSVSVATCRAVFPLRGGGRCCTPFPFNLTNPNKYMSLACTQMHTFRYIWILRGMMPYQNNDISASHVNMRLCHGFDFGKSRFICKIEYSSLIISSVNDLMHSTRHLHRICLHVHASHTHKMQSICRLASSAKAHKHCTFCYAVMLSQLLCSVMGEVTSTWIQ